MKFLLSWILLSNIMGSYFGALIALALLYFIIDKFFFGFTRSFLSIILRKRRIRYYLGELKLNPQNAKSMFELGQLYFDEKRYTKSVEYLTRARPKFPNSPHLLAYLGMSQICLKQFDEGKSNIEKALELEKGVLYGLPYVYLIAYEINKTDIDNSKINEYESWFDRYSITENYYRLGVVYHQKAFKSKSKIAFEKAFESYKHCNKSFRKLHRKWALLARIRRYPVFVAFIVLLILFSSIAITFYKNLIFRVLLQ